MATTVSAYTADELDTLIASAKLAIAAAQGGKAYSFQGRSVARQDLKMLQDHLAWCVAEKNKLDRGGIRARRVIPQI